MDVQARLYSFVMGLVWGIGLLNIFPSAAAQEIPQDFSQKPVFVEEFDGVSLSTSRWSYRDLGVRNHCINSKDAVSLIDGYLRITTFSEQTKQGHLANYCGMISTENSFRARYGYWVARVRFQRVAGMQCAFWLQSSTIGKILGNAKESGVEMDVFEHLAEASSDGYDHALHWDGYGASHKQIASKRTLEALQDGNFHEFAIAWRPSGYTFYIDGQPTYAVPANEAPVSAIPEYIILSSEVPRAFPEAGFGGKSQSQATFDVDYVRVYPYKPENKEEVVKK